MYAGEYAEGEAFALAQEQRGELEVGQVGESTLPSREPPGVESMFNVPSQRDPTPTLLR